MERVNGIEPIFPTWKDGTLTFELYPRIIMVLSSWIEQEPSTLQEDVQTDYTTIAFIPIQLSGPHPPTSSIAASSDSYHIGCGYTN